MLDSLAWVTEYDNFTGTWFEWNQCQGDTTINGYDYKIYSSGLLREDTLARKVYKWDGANNSDLLLYDFTLNVGDTFHINSPTVTFHQTTIVTGKDSVLTSVGYRDRWFIVWHDALNSAFTYTIVEGIGSLIDPIRIICPPNFDPQWHSSCFYHNGIKVYGSLCPNYLTNFQLMVTPSRCGLCNGSVIAFSTFVPDTLWWVPEYSWTPHGPAFISGLCPLATGTVIVTQTSTGFQYIDGYMIGDNPPPLIQNNNILPASCQNCCDGSISVNAIGSSPSSYTWYPNVSTTDNATGLCPGQYFITVSDSTGCNEIDTVTLSFTTFLPENKNDKSEFVSTVLYNGEHLTLNSDVNASYIEIYSASGSLVYRRTNYKDEFNASDVDPGVYFIYIILMDGSQYQQKLCIIK